MNYKLKKNLQILEKQINNFITFDLTMLQKYILVYYKNFNQFSNLFQICLFKCHVRFACNFVIEGLFTLFLRLHGIFFKRERSKKCKKDLKTNG